MTTISNNTIYTPIFCIFIQLIQISKFQKSIFSILAKISTRIDYQNRCLLRIFHILKLILMLLKYYPTLHSAVDCLNTLLYSRLNYSLFLLNFDYNSYRSRKNNLIFLLMLSCSHNYYPMQQKVGI